MINRKIDENEPKNSSRTLYIVSALIGVAIGIYISLNPETQTESLPISLLFLIVSLFLGIVIHELGHLVFGILTGYRFSSFRIMSLMLYRRSDGRLAFTRRKIPGTSGQCLMSPPDSAGGRVPFVLYNLGGSLFNLITALISIIIRIISGRVYLLADFLVLFSVVSLAFALMNAIPMRLSLIPNDGYNLKILLRDPPARDSFLKEMRIAEASSKGILLSEMPEDWFSVPEEGYTQNHIHASIAVLRAERLIDLKSFAEAREAILPLLGRASMAVGAHRALLGYDLVFLNLYLDGITDDYDNHLTAPDRKFISSLRNDPSVIRTDVAVTAITKGRCKELDKLLLKLDRQIRLSPTPAAAKSEREAVNLFLEKYGLN